MAGSFLLARLLQPAQPASANPPPDATPWYWPLLEAEEGKPRPEGIFSGITVGSDAERVIDSCDSGKPKRGQIDRAYGSELDPRPAYLPDGTEPSNIRPSAAYCGDEVVSAEQEYYVPPDPQAGRYGGYLIIYRAKHKAIELDYAAERLTESAIDDRPAIVVEPLTDDGFGNSAVVINEPFGISVIQADGIATSELLKIASSLFRSER